MIEARCRDTARAKGCGAPIVFVATASGRLMPLDDSPALRFALFANPAATFEAIRAAHGDAISPHWVTCPHAAMHRRKPARAEPR
jgi:hypothetical protein